MVREWAAVPYVPTHQYESRDSQPYQYLATRVRHQQGELFKDGAMARHFAVVTNIWDMDGQELPQWQRDKAGTIEHIWGAPIFSTTYNERVPAISPSCVASLAKHMKNSS